MKKEQLLIQARELPLQSGVYKMYNASGEIIYVGKAKNLRNRVRSYFDNSPKNLKTVVMSESVDHFDYILTPSEAEAFSLECNLIKENRPKYNILLKDDKAFPYIRIDRKQRFPLATIVRRVKNDGALYFGPFVTGVSVGQMLEIIKSVFKIRTCKINFERTKQLKRPCVLGEIGSCIAPCVNAVSEEKYGTVIDEVTQFLNGKNSAVKRILRERMKELAANGDFENAIKFRDQLALLERSEEKIITSLTRDSSIHVFAFESEDDFVSVSISIIRGGKMVAENSFMIDCLTSDSGCMQNFVVEFYENNPPPDEILVSLSETQNLEKYLIETLGKRVRVVNPKIGQKKIILEMAIANARECLRKNKDVSQRREQMTVGALKDLENILGTEQISRIEGFDISNISGTDSVSSMVVFVDGVPAKKEYRKFKIKTVVGANDFASMAETIRRRFSRALQEDEKFVNLPDLILIDGGLGQLHAGLNALEELKINVPIISLAKSEEIIFTSKSSTPIRLDKTSPALRLLQRVRDESHRFAIGYHRNLRGKVLSSELENIPGVGKKRARSIMSAFGSSEDLLSASIEEFTKIEGINAIMAGKIFEYLHR